MDDISKNNIKRLKEMGDYWFKKYGESAIDGYTIIGGKSLVHTITFM